MTTPRLHWGGLGSTLVKLLCVLRMIPLGEIGAVRRVVFVVFFRPVVNFPILRGRKDLFFPVSERVWRLSTVPVNVLMSPVVTFALVFILRLFY